jgi:hypothetical protein
LRSVSGLDEEALYLVVPLTVPHEPSEHSTVERTELALFLTQLQGCDTAQIEGLGLDKVTISFGLEILIRAGSVEF